LERLEEKEAFDLLLVARANGAVVTKSGEWTKGGDAQDALEFSIGIISRESGRIVHYCVSTADGDYVGDPSRFLSGPIRKCLQQWVKASSL
jgi:hypothetical protein